MCSRPLNFTLSPKLHVPPPSPNYTLLYLFCWFFYLFVLRQVLTVNPWLVWSSLYRPGWPRIHKDLPVSTSGVLYLKAWATTSSLLNNLCKKVGIFSWNKLCVCNVSDFFLILCSWNVTCKIGILEYYFVLPMPSSWRWSLSPILCYVLFLETVSISHTFASPTWWPT